MTYVAMTHTEWDAVIYGLGDTEAEALNDARGYLRGQSDELDKLFTMRATDDLANEAEWSQGRCGFRVTGDVADVIATEGADQYMYVVEEGEVSRFIDLEHCPPRADLGNDWIIVWACDERHARHLARLYDKGYCPDKAVPTNEEIGWPEDDEEEV